MDILAIVRLLWRQRWVVAATSVVSLALLTVVVVQAPPKYEAKSAVVLFNPPKPPDTVKVVPGTDDAKRFDNPYVRFNDTSVVVDILRRAMASDETAARLQAKGVGSYVVAANIDFYRGPIIDVSATAVSDAQAVSSTKAVVEELETTLTEMQRAQGTDPAYYFTADIVVPASGARRVITSTLRRAIGAAAVAGFLVLASAVVADTIRSRRNKSRVAPVTEWPGDNRAPGWDGRESITAGAGGHLSVIGSGRTEAAER